MNIYKKYFMIGCAVASISLKDSLCAVIPFETIMTSASNEQTNTTVFNTFVQGHQYVIAKFYENWCGPCRSLSEVVERVMKKYPQVFVLEIAAAKYPITGYKITSLPTVVYFMDGKEVAVHKGYVGDVVFVERIHTHFGL